MHTRTAAPAMAAILAISTAPNVYGQDRAPQWRPLELWVCSYRDGMTAEEMKPVYGLIEDESEDVAYAAWQLDPVMVGTLTGEFDFVYIGAWADNTTMGADLENVFSGQAESSAAWNETVDCEGEMYASLNIQDVENDPADFENFFMTVSDCTVADAASNFQAISAIRSFNDYRTSNGQAVFSRAWFPVLGGGQASFDFKLIHSYPGMTELGAANQWVTDNQAYRVRGDLMAGVVECDDARLYAGTTIMDRLNQ